MKTTVRRCIVCACTDDMGCDDGMGGACSWVKKIGKNLGLCSSCPDPVNVMKLSLKQRMQRKELAAKVVRIEKHRRQQMWAARSAQDGYESAVEEMRTFEMKLQQANP